VDGSLAGPRILLRHVADEDLPAIKGWWPEAEASVRGVREPEETDFATAIGRLPVGSDVLAIVRQGDAVPIGLLVYQRREDGWLEFRWLALAKGNRGWGYGSEAVMLVEEMGPAWRFAADVYAGNGLGLFFWLRMGYRPGRPPWKKDEATDRVTVIREQEE